MKTIRHALPIFALLAGCSAQSATADTAADLSASSASTSTAATAGAATANATPPPFRGPPGPGFLLVAALRELDLSSAQRATVESLVAEAGPPDDRHGPDASGAIAMAAAVRSGAVDVDSLKAKLVASHPAMNRAASTARALKALHDTLTSAQRAALVTAVTTRMENKGRKGPPDMAGGPPRGAGPMGGLLAGLALTAGQEDAIAKALAAARPAPPSPDEIKAHFEAMRAERKARIQTFADDSFDATAFVAPPAAMAGMPKPEDHAARMANDIAIITALLQPAQREQLAAKLEQGPPAP